MEYRNISETLSKRDKKAIRRARAAIHSKTMVKKIPKDHMGLYLSVPFSHGRQSHISDGEELFHDTLHKEGCREAKTYYPLCKKVRKMEKTIIATFKLQGMEKQIERMKARIASLSAQEEVISLYIKEKEV